MTDVHNKITRKYNMSRVSGKNTLPELMVRKFLHSNGLRFKLHDKALPGKPDIVLPKYKVVIFVNGCFWHGHTNCKYASIPKTRTEWWENKINKNSLNDKKSEELLKQQGWRVIKVWTCQLKPRGLKDTLDNLLKEILLPYN